MDRVQIAAEEDSSPPPPSGRQFNLRDLFVFMLACGVYLAMIVSLRATFSVDGRQPVLSPDVAVPASWVVLWIVYHWSGPRQALIVHYSGPAIMLCLLLPITFFAMMASAGPEYHWSRVLGDMPEIFYYGMLIGCGLGTLVSFPAALLMRLYLLVQPPEMPAGGSHQSSSSQHPS